ncbi:MAG: PaaI family thioesterase [Coriobacteriia bacterium]|nr:PaaI family thioesterase [Coriobacteriia bacterium]
MDRTVLAAQNVSRMCMVCGTENPAGLGARFYNLEDGELVAVFTPRPEHQGYPGRLHGGIASTLLDEAMGRALNIADPEAFGVTVELNVRFRKPVPIADEVRAVCRMTKHSSRLFEASGEIILHDGTVAVEASGRYLRMPIERIAEGDFDEQWFADPRDTPASIDV